MDQSIEKLVELSMLLLNQIDKSLMALLKECALILYLGPRLTVSLQNYVLNHLKVAREVIFKLLVLLVEVVLEFLDQSLESLHLNIVLLV